MRHNALSMTTRVRHTSALAAGSAVSGLLAYVFFAVVTRALGSTAAAPVSVLWAYWSFAGAALTFPLQHWIARSVSAHGGERSVREPLPGIALVSLLLAVVMTGASLGRAGPALRLRRTVVPAARGGGDPGGRGDGHGPGDAHRPPAVRRAGGRPGRRERRPLRRRRRAHGGRGGQPGGVRRVPPRGVRRGVHLAVHVPAGGHRHQG